MYLYNTMSRKKEELVPQQEKQVNIYACGPTVYNYIHIGNARPICAFDVLRRYLTWRGYSVKYVQNFTDVDDKIIKRANEEGITAAQVAEKYIAEYKTDAHGLNVMDADVHPRVTDTMEDIIRFVQALVDSGHAYEAEGDVYFRTSSFPEYGKLSKNSMEDLQAGARIGVDERKENALDFAVWKAAKPGEPYWESPWGKGRPGWHIECSAMIRNYLGETIDIHCGGQDLIFPHHENEISQGECCTGKPYAHYWMHNGYINVDNVKMSKSLGNFFTVRDVAEKYGYEPIKFMMIQAHYRMPLNYTVSVIESCKAALERLYTCRDNLDFAIEKALGECAGGEEEFLKSLDEKRGRFIAAMDDDLNTADAVSVLFDLVRDINTYITSPHSKASLEAAAKLFDEITGVLGILYNRKKESLDDEVEAMIAARQQARKEKNWAEADRIRDELKSMGIVLEDTPQGVKWKKA